jgi:hypothetical protein
MYKCAVIGRRRRESTPEFPLLSSPFLTFPFAAAAAAAAAAVGSHEEPAMTVKLGGCKEAKNSWEEKERKVLWRCFVSWALRIRIISVYPTMKMAAISAIFLLLLLPCRTAAMLLFLSLAQKGIGWIIKEE